MSLPLLKLTYIADVLYDDNQKQLWMRTETNLLSGDFLFTTVFALHGKFLTYFIMSLRQKKSSAKGRISKDDITTTILFTLSAMLLKPYELPMHHF